MAWFLRGPRPPDGRARACVVTCYMPAIRRVITCCSGGADDQEAAAGAEGAARHRLVLPGERSKISDVGMAKLPAIVGARSRLVDGRHRRLRSPSGRTTVGSSGRQTFGYAEDMSGPGVKVRMSYAEYLSAEAQSEVKHQFADGEMFARAGGTRRHAYLQTRVVVALGNALRNHPCVPYGSELRVYLPTLGEGTYPDASIVYGRFLRASEDPEATVNPAALVEVLSPTTEAYDRGRKFEKYQTLPSFREYLLVSQDRPRVERYVRGDDGSWIWRAYAAGERVPLACAGVDLAVDDLYAGAFNADDDAAPTG